MSYAIMLGSNMFIGTNGIMSVEVNNRSKEFFRIREIYRVRSEGSYLVVDCDIKDNDGVREVKLAKSNPVAADENVRVEGNKQYVIASRPNGSVIVKVEQIEPNDPSLPVNGPVRNALDSGGIDAILRITGDFFAGGNHLRITNSSMVINTNTIAGFLSIGTGGLRLVNDGFVF